MSNSTDETTLLSNKVNSSPDSDSERQTNISRQAYIQKIQDAANTTFLLLVLSLSWNLITILLSWIHGYVDLKSFLLAVAYVHLGIPAAYFTWFRTLKCLHLQEIEPKKHSKWFSVYMYTHIGFCMFAFINPFTGSFVGKSITGMMSAFEFAGHFWKHHDVFMAILHFIGYCFFITQYAVSNWLMAAAYRFYNSDTTEQFDEIGSSKKKYVLLVLFGLIVGAMIPFVHMLSLI